MLSEYVYMCYDCMEIKTLYGYEVGGLPCTSGYRGITVYCYRNDLRVLSGFLYSTMVNNHLKLMRTQPLGADMLLRHSVSVNAISASRNYSNHQTPEF